MHMNVLTLKMLPRCVTAKGIDRAVKDTLREVNTLQERKRK